MRTLALLLAALLLVPLVGSAQNPSAKVTITIGEPPPPPPPPPTPTTGLVFNPSFRTLPDTTSAGTSIATFAPTPDNSNPAIASCSQSPCPFTIGGSTGAWVVLVANGITLADANNQQFTVQTATAGAGTLTYSIVPEPIAPGQIACDIGPPYQGSIPGPAAAYGFTHCLNFDFTYTSTFTNAVSFWQDGNTSRGLVPPGQSYQWSNKASWWDKAGAGDSALFTGGSGFNNPNQVQLVTDPVSGQQALLLQVFSNNDGTPSGTNTPVFPSTNAWIEETARVNPNNGTYVPNGNAQNNGEIIDDFGYWNGNFQSASYKGSPYFGGGMEVDFGLTCFGNATTNPTQGCAGNGAFVGGARYTGQPHFDPCCGVNLADGNYHTTGSLYVASRTQWAFAFCGYYDHQKGVVNFDHSQSYNCWQPSNPDGNGSACNPDGVNGGGAVPWGCLQEGELGIGSYVTHPTNTIQQWISSIVIWTCPGWNTQTGAPSEVGGGTAYNTCDSGSAGIPSTGASGPAWPSD